MTPNRHDDKKKSRKPQGPIGKSDSFLHSLGDFEVEEIELKGSAPPPGPSQYKTPPSWWPALRIFAGAVGLTLIVVLAAMATRSAWPTDETRLLAIAWEMWSRGDWLVPRLNGDPYSTAPMYFWIVQLGWRAFGVVEWLPRAIPAVFMLASLLLAARMSRFLWPGQREVARYMPLALLGSFYWILSSTLLSIDMLTVFFTLSALTAVLWMWRKRDQRVWLLLAVVFGLGLLTSGSLILLYVLPVALLAPLWSRGTATMPWNFWYIDIIKAVLVGLVLYAVWAVPAAQASRVAIVLAPLLSPLQTASLDLFAAARPWWWYLYLLPALAFPWVLWPLPWMRFWHIRREPINSGLAFCMVWAVMSILLFSVFETRQPQFLLPVLPAFYLGANWLLLDEGLATHDHSRLATTMIFPLLLLGGLLSILPGLPHSPLLPAFLWQLSPFVGVGVIAIGVAVGWLPLPEIETRVANMTASVTVISTLMLLVVGWQYSAHFEQHGAAKLLAMAEQQGSPVGFVGPYSGEFQFNGRLTKPLEIVPPDQVELWAVAHPNGLIVTYENVWQPRAAQGVVPLYDQSYSDTQLRIWPATPSTSVMELPKQQ